MSSRIRPFASGQPRPAAACGRGGHVLLAHQAFADEKGVDPDRREPQAILVGEDATFGDDDPVLRDEPGEVLAHRERSLEIAQIAVVDADEPRLQRQGAGELMFVVDFDQHIHLEIMRRLVECARRVVLDGSHDDEDRVGAPGARLEHLIGIIHEVLAQNGQMHRAARGDEMLWPALERRRVGQNREACGMALRIGDRQRRRIEIGADQAFRRAGLLDFARSARTGRLRARPAIGLDEAARRILVARSGASSACSGMRTLASEISVRL